MNLGRLAIVLLWASAAILVTGRAWAIDIKEVTTPLGIKAWLVEDRNVPIVTLSFSFADGTALEPRQQKGVTSLMASLLTDGAGALDAQAFRRRQEEASASLSFGASLDRTTGSLRTLSAKRDEGFELLRLALDAPRFDEDMLERRRAQFIAGLNQAEQRPASVAERTLSEIVFAGHPYATDSSGMREALRTLTRDDVKSRATAVLDRTGMVVAAVGDIDEADLSRLLDRTFGMLPAGAAKPSPPGWAPPMRPRTVVVERPVPQSAVRIAVPAVTRNHPDWFPASVMTHILGGGGQQSRLFDEVREKRGLAYGVSAGLRPNTKASLLVVSTASANERVAEAIRVIRGEMARLRDDGVVPQELADAKTYLSGSLPVSLDSSASVAGLLHSMQVDGLARDYLQKRSSLIEAVTLQDVRRMARQLLRDDVVTSVVVGKPIGLRAEP
ncbi:MAG: insulinase family protein [Enhydrobacter sp.]|nr:MAG: insulinase family protein [Enhydrobacter sp.]